MIPTFIEALRRAGLDLTGRELEEVLWLAPFLPPGAALKERPSLADSLQEGMETRAQESEARTQDEAEPGGRQPGGGEYSASASTSLADEREVDAVVPSCEGAPAEGRLLEFRSAAAPALPHALALSRALRPLKRRIPSRWSLELDEAATVDQVARGGPWVPVLCPARERWLEVVLVVDSTRSMALWRDTLAELRRLLRHHGAFRDVRTWWLVEEEDGKPRLTRGARPHLGAPARSWRELVDPKGRTLTLLASDCVSPGWHSGVVEHWLYEWGRRGPVAILQLLPARAWGRTALRRSPPVWLRSGGPGASGGQLAFATAPGASDQRQRRSRWGGRMEVGVPVFNLEREAVSSWARLVAGAADAWTPGVLLKRRVEFRAAQALDDASEVPGPLERVERFDSTASSTARRLARLLAAAPLSLRIMQLVRDALLPEAEQVHLAEVFLGGLLKERGQRLAGDYPDEVRYDFAPGVRQVLLESSQLPDSVDVLQHVSTYLKLRMGQPLDFPALLRDPAAVDAERLAATSQPFAHVAVGVLKQLGGQYANLAAQMESALARSAVPPGSSRLAKGVASRRPAGGPRESETSRTRVDRGQGPTTGPYWSKGRTVSHRLRILHISDLHIRGDREKEAWRRRRVLGDAWKRNLDEVVQNGPVDLVAFAGDLAFSGRPVEYEGVGQFLDELLSRVKCPRERLFLVPGNHDVARSVAPESWKELRELLRPGDAQEFSQWMASPDEWAPRGFRAAMRDEVLSRQAAYREWVAKGLGRPGLLPSSALHPRLGYRETLRLPGQSFDVHVIGLDSAWLAGDDSDSGRLWLTEDQVMRLATQEGQPLAGVRLALIHHPLEQLMDGAQARRLLAKHVDVLLRGHLHEAEAVLSEDPSSALRSLAAGCLYESDRYPNSCQLIQLTVDETGRPEACEVWFRSWSSRGHWYSDDSQYPGTRAGWLRWWGPAPREAPLPSRAGLFVGQVAQLQAMARALLPAEGAPVPVAIQGMPGVGKSYLVGHFYREHARRFPGGLHHLALQPGPAQDAEALLSVVADRLGVTAGPGVLAAVVREKLRLSSGLLVIDNVDGPAEALAAADVVRRLTGCAVVVSGRLQSLGYTAGWVVVSLRPLEASLALEQLSKEYRAARGAAEEEGFARLVRELGYLPLAIHLAAGYLRRGHTVDGFLAQMQRKGLALGPADPASELLSEGASRAVLRTSLELSLELLRTGLREEWGEQAPRFLQGMAALGYAPAAGVGRSLGAAVAGLSEDEFGSLVGQAVELSILEKVPEEEAPRQDTWRVHPLLAALLREGVERDTVIGRMTDWFAMRLPEAAVAAEQGRRWTQVTLETTSLASWLSQVPVSAAFRVVEAGASYAQINGPFLAWAGFAERALLYLTEPLERFSVLLLLARVSARAGLLDKALSVARESQTLARSLRQDLFAAGGLDLVADILEARGELDEALRIRREEVLPVIERQGDMHARAIILGKVADILKVRGRLDEALRIRHEEEVPVFERLGDMHARAVSLGKVADIFEARGELDEALRIHREEVLPVFERLGDVRSRALSLGKVADILEVRGELDEALRIRREEELPVYKRLGDVHSQAVTLGQVAAILRARGDLDEALRIHREEELPVYERLGDVRSRAITLGNVAAILRARGELDEALRIHREEVLPVFERLGDVRSRAFSLGKVADILQARGELEEALRIRREEELPVYERLGDVHSRALSLGKVADILQARGDLDEALRIRREEELPVYERLGDVRSWAVTLAQVADIHEARGELDEASRLREQASEAHPNARRPKR